MQCACFFRFLAAAQVLFALLVFGVAATTARAAETAADGAASAWAETVQGAVRLVAATDAVGQGAALALGLEFRMQPGWHIYWRSPGDAGYPPRIDWAGSDNLASAQLSWPAPERFTAAGLETIGYAEAVLLPIEAKLQQPGEPATLRATVDYLTCADICVPYVADLTLVLPAGPAQPSAFAHAIAQARAAVPGDGAAHGVTVDRAAWIDRGGERGIEVAVTAREPWQSPDLFVEGPSPLVFDAPQMQLENGGRTAVFTLTAYGADGVGKPLAGLPVTITIVDGGRAAEQTTTIAAAAIRPADAAGTASSLPFALALAVLGGLILNLMPCVLPVLSIKLLSVVRHGGGDRRQVRLGFLAAAAGILCSFLVLASLLAALKASGAAIGWGLQFQQPWFLIAMVLTVVLFAANLWGLFEVPLPQIVARTDARAGRVGGLAGHFLTGALATLLATPCSAPFLGTAIGFALARGPAEIVLVFAAIAIGLAAPYLLVAAVPSLATRLPRPGAWMGTLRRVLGLVLIGTAGWLLVVLAGQLGWRPPVAVAAIALLVLLLLAARRILPARLAGARWAGVIGLGAGAFLVPAWTVPAPVAAPVAAGHWQPFDPERIPQLVADGHTVFVNVTADWCLTCKVNERLVLSRDAVRGRLEDDTVVAMLADWTAADARIARYLASFGRYGIPFDAVYGPAVPAGEALPELLSESLVIGALDRAQHPINEGANAGAADRRQEAARNAAQGSIKPTAAGQVAAGGAPAN